MQNTGLSRIPQAAKVRPAPTGLETALGLEAGRGSRSLSAGAGSHSGNTGVQRTSYPILQPLQPTVWGGGGILQIQGPMYSNACMHLHMPSHWCVCTLAWLHTGMLTGTCTQQLHRPCTQRQPTPPPHTHGHTHAHTLEDLDSPGTDPASSL